MKKSILLTISLAGIFLVACNNEPQPFDGKALFKTVEKFVALGEHRTGTTTDTATSYWLGKELQAYGYEVKYLSFPLRQFFPERVYLAAGPDTITAFPLWWIGEQTAHSVTGALVDVQHTKTGNKNAIALIHFPRPGGQSNAQISGYLDSLINTGVAGIVAITDNASGEIEAYNTRRDLQPWRVPVILVAPKDSSKINTLIKKEVPVTVAVNGTFKDVKARNVYGTIGNGDNYIVISTPISGWFTCGGERGPGVAIWLGLAKWAASQKTRYTFVFTGNSGHELDAQGAREFLENGAPPVEKTHLWLHLGAGVATLNYLYSDSGLVKQTTVDVKRRFFYNAAVKTTFEKAFRDIAGEKLLVEDNPGGELLHVAHKGYLRYAGVSYSHPFFHVKTDNAATTSPEILEKTGIAFRNFVLDELKQTTHTNEEQKITLNTEL